MLYRNSFDNNVVFFLIILIISMAFSAFRGKKRNTKRDLIISYTKSIKEQIKLYALKVPERERYLVKWNTKKELWLQGVIEKMEIGIRIIVEKHHEKCAGLKIYDKKLMEKICNKVKPIKNIMKNKRSSYKDIKDPYLN